MRTFTKTHPWINFKIDLTKASYKLWMLLGEAQSKCTHIAGIPLMPQVAEHLHQLYLAKGVQATTAIEGNTLTEKEVMERLQGKLELPPSKEYLGQEVDNIIKACNEIATKIFQNHLNKLTVQDIKDYNALVLRNLPLDDYVVPGKIRTRSVGVARYLAVDAEDCEYLLDKLCDWLNEEFKAPEGYTIAFGILKAVISHVYLAWIHPFGDGNGRTARLVEFQLLLSTGISSAASHLLSNHYNQTRNEYYRQLDYASKSGGDLRPFIEYALRGYIDGLKSQIEVIRSQQWAVHWRNFVFDLFRDKNSPADIRRRHLIFDLSDNTNKQIPISKVRHISPRIAEAYSRKTQKTIIRDINILHKMGLLEKTLNSIRVKKEIILAFLPATKQS